jgi:capsular exopolysaccharide synthesis family protein
VSESRRYESLRDYLRVLREQALVIALITLVAGGVAYVISEREDPVYEASSAIAFQDETQQLSLLGGSVSPTTPAAKTPQARAQTIDEPEVFDRISKELPEDQEVDPGLLRGAVSTALDEESFLVDVTASWGEAEFAADLANAFAATATRYTNEQARQDYEDALEGVQERLDDLGNDLEDQTERGALTEQLTRLRFLADNAEPASVVETAQAPSEPTTPRTTRNTALGLLLGLIIGIVVAFLRDTLDRRMRGTKEVQEELGYPLLGQVRAEALGSALRVGTPADERLQPDLEALRIVRQNIEFLSADRPPRTIVVTSPLPEEGKTTVATALAFASAAAGKRTLLVECDLRRPDVASRLGLHPAPGLTDYLVGQAEPRAVLQMVAPAPLLATDAGNGPAPQPGGLAQPQPVVCIAAGTPSPQPAELLGSERFRLFMDEVSQAYDTVVVDTTPLLPVADALELLPLGDVVVLCIRSGQTTRDQAGLARAALERSPDEGPVGIVVTGLQRRDTRDYGYSSYAYTYHAGVGQQNY